MTRSIVLKYPNCVMFNMERCSRIKKKSSINGSGEKVEVVGDLWENDDDIHLIIRLVYQEYPWVVAHYGLREVINAPLVLPIRDSDVDKKTIGIIFRDFSNRDGDDCIKRKFYLEFPSAFEADIFKYAHNKMLLEYRSSQDKNASRGKPSQASIAATVVEPTKVEPAPDKDAKKVANEPASKKRRISRISQEISTSNESVEKGNGGDSYEALVETFQAGDEHDFLDDCFEETQDPYYDNSE